MSQFPPPPPAGGDPQGGMPPQPPQPPQGGSAVPPPPPGGATPPPPPPPPPGGGYPGGGMPPGGGYPGGGYPGGGMPPGGGYPGGGYPGGMPPGGPKPFSAGDAIGYGWKKTFENFGPILIAMIVFLLIGAVIGLLQALLAPDTTTVSGENATFTIVRTGSRWASIFSLIFGVIVFVWNFVVEAALARGGLALTEGRPVVLGDLLNLNKIGSIILGGIILGIFTVIGLILCILPGLIVIFFGSFYVYFILDQGQGAWEAIKSSFSFVKDNIGNLLLLLILTWLVLLAGALLCGVGLIIAIPVVAIAKAYAYKVLRGQQVAPA